MRSRQNLTLKVYEERYPRVGGLSLADVCADWTRADGEWYGTSYHLLAVARDTGPEPAAALDNIAPFVAGLALGAVRGEPVREEVADRV